MLRWLQTEKFAITADKLPTRYLGIDIQRTEDGSLLPKAKLISALRQGHQNLGSSYKTENSVYTSVYNRFFRKHGRFDRRNGQRNRAVTHTPNLSTTFAGIRRRCVRELRRVGQGGVRRFVPKSLSHGADQRARLARQKKPPKPVTLMPGLPW
jgi:ABC-type thiamine transport system ATPase subunit